MSGARVTIATKLKRLIKKLGASKRNIAKRMGTSTGQLLRILDPKYMDKVKLRSLERVAEVLGYRLELTLVPECEESSGATYTIPKELYVEPSGPEEYVEVDSDQITFTNKALGQKGLDLLEGMSIKDLEKEQLEEPQIGDLDEENAILYITWLLERGEETKAESIANGFARINPKTSGHVSSLTVHVYKTWLLKKAKAMIQSEKEH